MGFWVGVSRLEDDNTAALLFFASNPLRQFQFHLQENIKKHSKSFLWTFYGAWLQLNAPDAALEAIANKRMIKKILVVVTTCTVMVKRDYSLSLDRKMTIFGKNKKFNLQKASSEASLGISLAHHHIQTLLMDKIVSFSDCLKSWPLDQRWPQVTASDLIL